jgi:hypothetical protein
MDLPAKLQHFALRLSAYGLKVKGSHHGGTEERTKSKKTKKQKNKKLGMRVQLGFETKPWVVIFSVF